MFLKRLKLNSDRGYSLVELMAVIAIIGIMSIVAFSNYNSSRQTVVLDKSVQQVIMDIRRVQNMAIMTSKFNSLIPSGGYGIHLDQLNSAYTIFADCDNNKFYSGASLACGTAVPGVFVTEKFPNSSAPDITFDPGVQMTANFTDITFVPPDSKIFVDNLPNVAAAAITLVYMGSSRTISINGITGQVTAN